MDVEIAIIWFPPTDLSLNGCISLKFIWRMTIKNKISKIQFDKEK